MCNQQQDCSDNTDENNCRVASMDIICTCIYTGTYNIMNSSMGRLQLYVLNYGVTYGHTIQLHSYMQLANYYSYLP